MALRIRCSCGKTLAVPDSLIGRKVACPGCKKTYRATPPAPEQKSEIELPSIDPASSPSELNLLEGIELMPRIGPTCPRCKKPQPPEARICVTCGVDLLTGKSVLDNSGGGPSSLSYAENTKPGLRARAAGREIVGEPKRSYAADAALAFIYPVHGVRNALKLLIIGGVSLLLIPFRVSIIDLLSVPLVFVSWNAFVYFVFNGWLDALYLRVVEQTAIAVDEMPGIIWEDGPIDDVVRPCFRYLGAAFCALAPVAVYALLLGMKLIPGPLHSVAVMLAWLAAGLFMWPLLVILFTFGATSKLYRIDFLIQAVFRTTRAYIALWGMLLIIAACYVVPLLGPILNGMGFTNTMPSIDMLGIWGLVGYELLIVYLMLVAMRQIGLYYLHFKNRIAFLFD